MFVLVNAPEGFLNDECSISLYKTHKEAHKAMVDDILGVLDPDYDDMDDYSVDEWSGTCYSNRSNAPEWHIYEAEVQ